MIQNYKIRASSLLNRRMRIEPTMDDIIAQQIADVLSNFEEECELKSTEKDKIANMVSSVVRSSFSTRFFFYTEVSRLLQEVSRRLLNDKNKLLNEIEGRKITILN